MSVIIKTDRSSLTIYSYTNPKLVRQCIEDVKDKLLENPPIVVYGRKCQQHRSIGFFSDTSIGYRYSNQLAKSQPLTPGLKHLMQDINKMFDTNVNGILVNRYGSGQDYIGKHSDDENGLSNIGVVSLSHGAVRKFRIRDKQTGKIVADIPTNSNEIIHMGGDFQKEFTHEIPQEKRIKDCRYSFTFRHHTK